jgi:hypothetical protein
MNDNNLTIYKLLFKIIQITNNYTIVFDINLFIYISKLIS